MNVGPLDTFSYWFCASLFLSSKHTRTRTHTHTHSLTLALSRKLISSIYFGNCFSNIPSSLIVFDITLNYLLDEFFKIFWLICLGICVIHGCKENKKTQAILMKQGRCAKIRRIYENFILFLLLIVPGIESTIIGWWCDCFCFSSFINFCFVPGGFLLQLAILFWLYVSKVLDFLTSFYF